MNTQKMQQLVTSIADPIATKLAAAGVTSEDSATVIYDCIEDIVFDHAKDLGFDLEDDDVQNALWNLADRLTHAVMAESNN